MKALEMKFFYLRFLFWLGLVMGAVPVTGYAQAGVLSGRVVDGASGKVVEYAHIHNYSRQLNMYCGSNGRFRLEADAGDTLVMYALGYFYQKVIVDASMLNASEPVDFGLTRQAYELTEARILAIGTYDEFKRDFMALEVPETRTDQLNNYLAGISSNEGKEAYEEALAQGRLKPTGGGIPIYTPEERERIKLAAIMEKEQVRDQIYQKYNPVVVKKVTGLTDDDEIIRFMSYCDFSDKYLLEVNDYDLAARIALKFEMYKRMKEEKKGQHDPLNRVIDIYDAVADLDG